MSNCISKHEFEDSSSSLSSSSSIDSSYSPVSLLKTREIKKIEKIQCVFKEEYTKKKKQLKTYE